MPEPLQDKDAIAIDKEGLIKVEKPLVKLGFLRLEIKGDPAGKILIDRREHPLSKIKQTRLYFNATVLGLKGTTQRERKARQEIRRRICEKLEGIDQTDEL